MKNYRIPQPTAPLNEWLYYIKHLHHQVIELGLERVKRVASHLELLTPSETVFTVAGTNGKGTTCRALETILLASNLRVGVYTSPHLIHYTERIRIQGKELSGDECIRAFVAIENSRTNIPLTYFEFTTLSALYVFKQARLDVIILEVGLGGRLDATNIIEPSVAVITNIALDHTNFLGNDREAIGREKAGILRSGKPAVIGDSNMPESIHQIALEVGAPLYLIGVSWLYSEFDEYWQWQCGKTNLTNLPIPNIPTINAATALAALSYSRLNITPHAIHSGLKKATLPGRFQIIRQEPRLILDVAHNPHASSYLAKRLARLPKYRGKLRAVIAMLSDKDIAGTLDSLYEQVDKWYCAPLNEPRGASSKFLAQYLMCPRQFITVKSAWRQAMQDSNKEDTIIVFGSFHTVAQVMLALSQN